MSKQTLKSQTLDFVEKKGKATWKEIHTFMLTKKGLDPNDYNNRGWYSSYFSGGYKNHYTFDLNSTYRYTFLKHSTKRYALLKHPTKKEPRYLEKEGKYYYIKISS